jgi:hypothetical protein
MDDVRFPRHTLVFDYRGTTWKAQWFTPYKAAILRQWGKVRLLANDLREIDPEVLPTLAQEDFNLVWSVARDGQEPDLMKVIRHGADIMRHWGWPKSLDLHKPETI